MKPLEFLWQMFHIDVRNSKQIQWSVWVDWNSHFANILLHWTASARFNFNNKMIIFSMKMLLFFFFAVCIRMPELSKYKRFHRILLNIFQLKGDFVVFIIYSTGSSSCCRCCPMNITFESHRSYTQLRHISMLKCNTHENTMRSGIWQTLLYRKPLSLLQPFRYCVRWFQ